MVIKYLISLVLFITPLMRASWDLWAQTVIHLLILVAILILIFKKEIHLPFYLSTLLPLFIFLFFCFISIFSSANLYESRNEFFNILNYVAIFYFAKNADKKYIVMPVLITGVILSIYGFYQKFSFSAGGNVPSFMNNPNVFAGYLIGIIIITLLVDHTVVQNKLKIILSSVFFIAVLFTGSLSGLLAAVSGLLFFAYIKKIPVGKKYLIFICIIIVFLLIVKLFEKESLNRIIWWLSAGKMTLAKPLSGIGVGAFADAYHKYKLTGLNSIYAHNYFLQMTSEIGIFGFAAFIWFLIKIFNFKKNSENIPFFASSFAMLVHGMFDYTLIIPANAVLFWTMLGYCSKEEKYVRILPTQNQKVIFRWISVFLISAIIYSQVMIFLASRETAKGKYSLDEKKYDDAKMHFTKAIKYDDKNPQTYFHLSNVYQQYYKITGYKSYLYESELELLKAAKLQKYNPQIYFDLYNIYYLRADMQNAALWMKKTLEESPESVYYKKSYETLLKEIHENTRHK